MINTHVVYYINFTHGNHQFIKNTQNYCVWFVTKDDNKLHKETVEMLSLPNKMLFTFAKNLNGFCSIGIPSKSLFVSVDSDFESEPSEMARKSKTKYTV